VGKPPRTLGDFELLDELGAGAMGTVYRARHVHTGATYAIKTLTHADPELLARFQREGEGQARVDDHPNVLRVRSLGQEGRTSYLVMDLASGGSLEDYLRAGLPSPERAAGWVRDLARAVEHAHRQGVLHRDLKPANVLFEGDVPLLVDFGLAKLVDARTLTETGSMVGTPAYMAPEQVEIARGGVGPAADVYGLGALLYRCLTGRPPFPGTSLYEVVADVMTRPPTPPRKLRPEIPARLEAICLRALAKAPSARPPSARAFADALDEALGGTSAPPAAKSPLQRAWALVPLVILAAGAAALATRPGPMPAQPQPTSRAKSPPTPRAALPPEVRFNQQLRSRACPGPHELDTDQARALRSSGDPRGARDVLLAVLRGDPCRAQAVALRELGCVYATQALRDMDLAQAYWLHAVAGGDAEGAWHLGSSLLAHEHRPFPIETPEHAPELSRAGAAIWLASTWASGNERYAEAAEHLESRTSLPKSERRALQALCAGRPLPALPELPDAPPTRRPARWAAPPVAEAQPHVQRFLAAGDWSLMSATALAQVQTPALELLRQPPCTSSRQAYEAVGWWYLHSGEQDRKTRAVLHLVRAALAGSDQASLYMAVGLLEQEGGPTQRRLGQERDPELAMAFLSLANEFAVPEARPAIEMATTSWIEKGFERPEFPDAYAAIWKAYPDAR
jgi:serine/threonine protein kinase/TPR repeat protein